MAEQIRATRVPAEQCFYPEASKMLRLLGSAKDAESTRARAQHSRSALNAIEMSPGSCRKAGKAAFKMKLNYWYEMIVVVIQKDESK